MLKVRTDAGMEFLAFDFEIHNPDGKPLSQRIEIGAFVVY
jgi:hypothetical protein